MEILSMFLKSATIGIAISAPVGPMGALSLRYSIGQSRMKGFLSGSGVAAGNAFGAFIVTFGFHGLTSFIIQAEQHVFFRLTAGMVLLWLGIKFYRTQNAENPKVERFSSHHSAFFTTFFFTISNPVTYILLSSFYAGAGILKHRFTITTSAELACGVLMGGCSIWFLLQLLISMLHKSGYKKTLTLLSHVTSLVITGFGVTILISCILSLK
ncbi:MAG: LysE family transporter [Candidatus Omnitrophica bacterium]|nr:LysE family transporter [Candidatus Omnitrophota bacterium]